MRKNDRSVGAPGASRAERIKCLMLQFNRSIRKKIAGSGSREWRYVFPAKGSGLTSNLLGFAAAVTWFAG
jgi:hypothetical protein